MQAEPSASLNLEYFLVRAADWMQNLNFGSWPRGTVVIVEDILILGMVLSLLLVVFIVYVMIRLHQVEHEGFHALEAHAHDGHGDDEHHGHDAEIETTHQNSRWDGIVALATGPSHGDWRRAILEADIMLFDVMREQGYPGTTVGEQLKNANPIQMTTLDLAWKAHKVRNDIAHGGEAYELTERDARATIDYYRRVFEELGAI